MSHRYHRTTNLSNFLLFWVFWKIILTILGTATGIKFAPSYACTYNDKIKTEGLQTQDLNHSNGWDLLMMYFLYGHMEKKILTTAWKTLTILNPVLNLLLNLK